MPLRALALGLFVVTAYARASGAQATADHADWPLIRVPRSPQGTVVASVWTSDEDGAHRFGECTAPCVLRVTPGSYDLRAQLVADDDSATTTGSSVNLARGADWTLRGSRSLSTRIGGGAMVAFGVISILGGGVLALLDLFAELAAGAETRGLAGLYGSDRGGGSGVWGQDPLPMIAGIVAGAGLAHVIAGAAMRSVRPRLDIRPTVRAIPELAVVPTSRAGFASLAWRF